MTVMTVAVYRAPMRSRRDDVDFGATIERALARGLCGFGATGAIGRTCGPPHRAVPRCRRGSFVWTRDPEWAVLARSHRRSVLLRQRWRAPPSTSSTSANADWLAAPLLEQPVPAAVVATFRRGGRNFQQTHERPSAQRVEHLGRAELAASVHLCTVFAACRVQTRLSGERGRVIRRATLRTR